MKYLMFLLSAGLLTSCGMFDKSEEAVVLTIDTASLLKGRAIRADITVNNSSDAECVQSKK